MKIITDPTTIDELLSRSVQSILPSKESLREILLSGRRLRIYIGADATGTALHLGHATNYIILEKFRRLGHEVIILIGDFTARIGDPTDKHATRVQLSREDVLTNTKTWLNQLAPIIDINNAENPVRVVYNHDWLSKMTFEEVIDLASNFTVQRMLERDMFEKRLKEQKPIYVHEFFYPLMQGWDSVHLDVDIEMCGTDQTFNALTGRTLLQKYKQKEKYIFITTLLENPVTKEKMMSKSLGTGIFLDMSPQDMFGKIMAQPDENIPQLFRDCTLVPLSKVDTIITALKDPGCNPRDIKMDLASEIVKMYQGQDASLQARKEFIQTFQKKELPTDIVTYISSDKDIDLVTLLVHSSLAKSKSDARRCIEAGAIKLNGQKIITNIPSSEIPDGVLQRGKRSFVYIKK